MRVRAAARAWTGASAPGAIARSASWAPTPWPATSGRGPHVSCRKPASTSVSHSGVYGWRGRSSRVAVQRQVGQHDAVAVRELVDDRLELAVGEPLRVQQRERRPGPGLAVRDPRAVGVVVQPQLHRGRQLSTVTSPAVGVASTIGQPVRRREDARILVRALASSSTTSALDGHAAHGVRALARTPTRGSLGGARRAAVPAARSRGPRVPAADRRAARAEVAHAPHPLLAAGEVRYVGQPVAAVVAASRARRPRTRPSASRSTTSRCRAVVDPRAGRDARALGEARGRRRGGVRAPPPTSCAPST